MRRPSLRRALIRFLGGSAAETPAAAPLPTPEPESDGAERAYAYAEQLNLQGAPDLAAAFYRQAYIQLLSSVGSGRPALPPARSPLPVAPMATAPAPMPMAPAPMATAPGTPVTPLRPVEAPRASTADLQQRYEQLKQALEPGNAAAVEQELMTLGRAGFKDPDLLNSLGLATLLQQRTDDAERYFRSTLQQQPDHFRAMVNLGGLCLSNGRLDEAQRLLQRSLELVDADTPAALAPLTNLALTQLQLGRPMESAQLVLRVLRIKPDHLKPHTLEQAAATLQEMGDEEGLLTVLQQLRRQQPSPDLSRRLAELLERRGQFQEAALLYRDLLGPVPTGAAA
ncbi:MAG: tetratricopeptide repeat protein [Prochlorococcaceae cyanobacterium]